MASEFIVSLMQSTRGGRVLSNGDEIIYAGKVVTLARETALFPDGRAKVHEIVRHPGGAAVVAIDGNDRVCLLRQWRHAAGGWIWELPAGKFDVEGETPLETAQRELGEEAGLKALEWTQLGTILTSPGFCDERLNLYMARNLSEIPTSHGGGELMEIHMPDYEYALAMAQDGEITDAKTLCGLFLAAGVRGGQWDR